MAFRQFIKNHDMIMGALEEEPDDGDVNTYTSLSKIEVKALAYEEIDGPFQDELKAVVCVLLIPSTACPDCTHLLRESCMTKQRQISRRPTRRTPLRINLQINLINLRTLQVTRGVTNPPTVLKSVDASEIVRDLQPSPTLDIPRLLPMTNLVTLSSSISKGLSSSDPLSSGAQGGVWIHAMTLFDDDGLDVDAVGGIPLDDEEEEEEEEEENENNNNNNNGDPVDNREAPPRNEDTGNDGEVPHNNEEITTKEATVINEETAMKEATANNKLAGSNTPMDTSGNDVTPAVTTTPTENDGVRKGDMMSMEVDTFFSEAATTNKPCSPCDE